MENVLFCTSGTIRRSDMFFSANALWDYILKFILCIAVRKNNRFEEICVTSLLQHSFVWWFFSLSPLIMVFNGKNLFGNVFWLLSHMANPELGLVVMQWRGCSAFPRSWGRGPSLFPAGTRSEESRTLLEDVLCNSRSVNDLQKWQQKEIGGS